MRQYLARHLRIYLRWLAQKYVALVEFGNKNRIRLPAGYNAPIDVLVDSQLRGEAIVAGQSWVDTTRPASSNDFWGNIKTGYLATKRYSPTQFNNLDIEHELNCLAALVRVASASKIRFCTCASLDSERITQKRGRYQLITWAGVDLFSNTEFHNIQSEYDVQINVKTFKSLFKGIRDDYSNRRDAKLLPTYDSDPDYNALLNVVKGRKKKLDVLHLLLAHKSNCPFFITLDGPLLSDFKEHGSNSSLSWFKTRVLKPSALADLLKIRPLKIDHLIQSEENWPSTHGSQSRSSNINKRAKS